MPSTQMTRRACLIVIDGWGIPTAADSSHSSLILDAIKEANPPLMSMFMASGSFPFVPLAAHGLAVGLPDGLMGNSEVGHLNLGAGRIVYQDIVRIDKMTESNTLKDNLALKKVIEKAAQGTKRLHLLGLVSDGGVHSHMIHLKALIATINDATKGSLNIFLHCITDGRDTAPTSAQRYAHDLVMFLRDAHPNVQIASVCGRYYAMDRDKRWERTEEAFNAIMHGQAAATVEHMSDLNGAMEDKYRANETDEFFKPMLVNVDGRIGEGDGLVCFNFRSDRMRQFCQMLLEKRPDLVDSTCTMTQYKEEFPFSVISPPQKMDNVLAEWLSKQGSTQCHVAETEKYAHVTFFFNGGQEKQFEGEERVLIASPKVATYDLKPEMSVAEVAQAMAGAVRSGQFDFVMGNLAPPDMVGHTGKFAETLLAVTATDAAIAVIYEACKQENVALFITADHGNAEQMTSNDGKPHTAHTCSPVPFICTDASQAFKLPNGRPPALCDVAPTILSYMQLPIPEEMGGQSLL